MKRAPSSPWTPTARATVACVLSAMLPGAGSYYLGSSKTAAVALMLETFGLLGTTILWRVSALPGVVAVAILALVYGVAHGGGALLGAVEAWRGSVKRRFIPTVGFMALAAFSLISVHGISWAHLLASYGVATIAMEPTLVHGDRVLVQPRGPRGEYRRGEILAIHDQSQNLLYVRRLIGLPGDEVRIDGAELFVNGSSLRVGPCLAPAASGCRVERSVDGLIYQVVDHIGDAELHLGVTVPPDAVFVMRDRRDLSIPLDPVPRRWLHGVVIDVWWCHTHRGFEFDRIGTRVAPEEER